MGCGEMPSETVYSKRGQVDVRVAWGGAGTCEVQVASLAAGTDPDPTERLINEVNQWLAHAGMTPIDLAKLRANLAYKPEFDGWHAQFDSWAEVNRLIKVLKRARDHAFGEPA